MRQGLLALNFYLFMTIFSSHSTSYRPNTADYSGHALKHWDRGFESHLRHVCLRLFCVQVAALRRADPPSKESYRLCVRNRKKWLRPNKRAVEP
jgi:hypothetical protein